MTYPNARTFTITYDPDSWGASPPAAQLVRFHCGDTDTGRPFLRDTEIDYLLDTYGDNVLRAAREAVDMILSRIASAMDVSGAGVSLQRDPRVRHFEGVRQRLDAKIAAGATPQVAGQSADAKQDEYDREDRVGPRLAVGMFNPVD